MKKILGILLTAAILFSAISPAGFAENYADELKDKVTALNAYIMDCETGETLYARAENEQLPVASIAKMMSVYVVLDKIKDGSLTLDTAVPISENVYKLSRVPDYKMMVRLEYDEVYTLDEMIDMIVIDSAAACVTAVAELVSGSETEFVKLMNAKAKEIGIDSVFYNGTGVCLNPETDKENLMSAKEVAVMAQHMIRDYPEILDRTKRASVDFHGSTYYNLNKLFTTYSYDGADGFKNGMTEASGYCMCGTAQRNGRRIITVGLRCLDNDARFTDTIAMFDYGFKKPEAAAGLPETPGGGSDEVKVFVDGVRIVFDDQGPVIIDGRTLVPIRKVTEAMGKKVGWDGELRRADVSDDYTTLELFIENPLMHSIVKNPVTGEISEYDTELDAPPKIINDRTCLPIRAVVEGFGMKVDWDDNTKSVLINTNERI